MISPEFWNESGSAPLINHIWQSTVAVAIAWALAAALRKNHARVRYWIWFAASVKFLLPFSLLIAAGAWLRSSPPAVVTATAWGRTHGIHPNGTLDHVERPSPN